MQQLHVLSMINESGMVCTSVHFYTIIILQLAWQYVSMHIHLDTTDKYYSSCFKISLNPPSYNIVWCGFCVTVWHLSNDELSASLMWLCPINNTNFMTDDVHISTWLMSQCPINNTSCLVSCCSILISLLWHFSDFMFACRILFV